MPGACISTNPSSVTTRLANPTTPVKAKLSTKLQSILKHRAIKRRGVRIGLVASNVVILAVIVAVVLQNPHTSGVSSPAIMSSSDSAVTANPVDQLSSAGIALTVARMSSLPETTAVTNQADSQAAELAMAPTSDNVVSKPQVVTNTLKSRADIETYKTAAGDTVSNLAIKFGVTSDSIRLSNNLSADALTPGTMLRIPPVNGLIYTVKAGDTPDSLASKFNASKDKIIAFNDAENRSFAVGEQIMIPDGTQAGPGASAAQVARTGVSASGASFAWGGGSPIYGYNGYDYGYCTWYVANKIAVPSNWGNANTWDNLAPRSGWTVSSRPKAGGIGQSDSGYYGHVVYIEAVSDDGTMIKYSDMNGLAGFGRVGYSGWVPATKFAHYIYR